MRSYTGSHEDINSEPRSKLEYRFPLHRIECNALPGSGTCSAMFTACTMASAVEALGMVVPGTASHPAVTAENSLTDQKKQDCVDSVFNKLGGEPAFLLGLSMRQCLRDQLSP